MYTAWTYIHTCVMRLPATSGYHTTLIIIFDSQFQLFERFSSSRSLLKTVESCFETLNYAANWSTISVFVDLRTQSNNVYVTSEQDTSELQ